MNPLELNILFFSEDDSDLRDLGIDSNEDDYVVDKMTFYNIDAVSPCNEEVGKNYSYIYVNGDEYICTENYQNVKSKIEKSKNMRKIDEQELERIRKQGDFCLKFAIVIIVILFSIFIVSKL